MTSLAKGLQTYNSAHSTVLGTIALNIVVGGIERKEALQVIDNYATSNLLFGHLWLHDQKVVP